MMMSLLWHENTSFVEGNYENELVLVLDSAFNYYPKALLIQVKKHKCTQNNIKSMHV